MDINNLVLHRGKKFAGLTEQNHLANAFLTEPETISPVISFIFGNYGKNPIDLLTGGLKRVKYVSNREFDWYLAGDIERTAVIVDSMTSTGSTIGKWGQVFRVKLNEKLFVSGEILVSDERDFPFIVVGDPENDGEGWIYTFKVISPNPETVIPEAALAVGKEISKEFSAYEELSGRSGSTYFNTPFAMRNQLTTHRKSWGISGSAASDVMVISMKDPATGKASYLWTEYQEWIGLMQWAKEKNRLLMYSQYNPGTIAGANGRPVYIGAGIREQIAPANKRYYTTLTENVIREFMMDLSYNVLEQGQRKFVALCGEYFMDAFDKAMKNVARGWQLVDTKFITGTGQELSFGGQFTTYKGLNGTEITLMHNPMYDDTNVNRKLHPVTKRPLESYRATFLDFSTHDGESNIQLIAKKDREMVMWHTGGAVTPEGHAKSFSTLRSNTIDGYECHALAEIGVMIKNPLSCGELICDAE